MKQERRWGVRSSEAHGAHRTPLKWGEVSPANSSAMDAGVEVKREKENQPYHQWAENVKLKVIMNKMMQKRKRTRRENFSQHSPALTTYHVKNSKEHRATPKNTKEEKNPATSLRGGARITNTDAADCKKKSGHIERNDRTEQAACRADHNNVAAHAQQN